MRLKERKKRLMKDFRRFFLTITKKDKVCVLYDSDGDGLCSAALLNYALLKTRGRGFDIFCPEHRYKSITNSIMKKILKSRADILFILDIPIDNKKEGISSLRRLLEKRKIKLCIFDHHLLENDLSKKALFVKTSLIEKNYHDYCTGKVVYDFLKFSFDISQKDWVAAVALISDRSRGYGSFLKIINNKYGFRKLNKINYLINAVYMVNDKKTSSLVKIMGSESDFGEIYNKLIKICNDDLKKVEFAAKKLLQKIMKEDFSKDIIIADGSGKYMSRAIVIDKISFRYPHKTILLYRFDNGECSVSARRQDRRFHMGRLLAKCVESFPKSSGGGHVGAAGCHFPKVYLNKFKENILKYHNEFFIK